MLYDLIEVSIFLILRAGSTVNLAGRENVQFYHFFPRESHRNVWEKTTTAGNCTLGQLKMDGTSIQNIDSEYSPQVLLGLYHQ